MSRFAPKARCDAGGRRVAEGRGVVHTAATAGPLVLGCVCLPAQAAEGGSLSTRDGALLKGMEGGRPQVVRRLARDVAEILLGLDGCTHRDEAVHKLPFSFCLPGRARSHLEELLDKEER